MENVFSPTSQTDCLTAVYNLDDTVNLSVRIDKETVWLTQSQIGVLFGVDRSVIVRHIGNVYRTGELEESSTCAKIAQVQNEGNRPVRTSSRIFLKRVFVIREMKGCSTSATPSTKGWN